MVKNKLKDNSIIKIIASNSRKGKIKKVLIENKSADKFCFQISEFINNQVFHKNIFVLDELEIELDKYFTEFKQFDFICTDKDFKILVNKNMEQKVILSKNEKNITSSNISHNREKNYILKDGEKIDFLIQQNVMTKDGKVINSMYKKFKQINRFLEFIRDVEKYLDDDGIIIDFGCGKSYLTFAMYYYLNVIKNKNLPIIGLDLKADIVERCNKLSEALCYKQLSFINCDIKDFVTDKKIQMVISLHACDTATDYALYNAINWQAKVILSVPCCQHEVNSQIKNNELDFILKYGILKERFSSILTDAVRAEVLSANGYQTDILEFIDMEHTPKNLMIRGILKNKNYTPDLDSVFENFNIEHTLAKLMK